MRRAMIAVVVLLVLAVPASALGAQARIETQGADLVVAYDGGPAAQDGLITFVAATGDYRVSDPNGINPGPGCSNLDADTISCPAAGVDRISASLGAAADTLRVHSSVPVPTQANGDAGDDAIETGALGDNLRGGSGDDDLKAGSGDDAVEGGLGDDTVAGGAGNDRLHGFVSGFDPGINEDDDEIEGGAGNDLIDATSAGGDDAIDGGAGDDQIHTGPDTDVVVGGPGADLAFAVADPDTGAGSTIRLDGAANDGVPGQNANIHADVERLTGSSGDDVLIGHPTIANVLNGGGGDDLLRDDRGAVSVADSLIGGTGFDVADYGSRLGDLTIRTSIPGGDGQTGEGDNVQAEHVIAGSGDDLLAGTSASGEILDGGAGNDTVSYADRSDGVEIELDAGGTSAGEDDLPGIENAIGGNGPDRIVDEGQGRTQTLAGGPGADTILAGGGADTVDGGQGSDVLDGGIDQDDLPDTLDYSGFSVPVMVSLPDVGAVQAGPAGDLDTIAEFENVLGGSGNDTLRGGDGSNLLAGNGGADALDGGGDKDVLSGGADPDAIASRDGVSDDVSCGGEVDPAVIADPVDAIEPDCEAVDDGSPPVDTTPPTLALEFKRRQPLKRRIPVKVRCNEDCEVVARGKVVARPPRTRSLKLKPASALLGANETRTLKLRLTRATLRKARRASKRGGRVIATIGVSATDGAGNDAERAAKVRLRAR